MLSDDVFRARLAATFADLKQTSAALADVALIDAASNADFVRISVIPHAAGACAFEVMLRADQLYDISFGTEFYEDCPIKAFDVFVPLIGAVSRGDIVQRHHVSAATGTERAVETIVTLPDGSQWRKAHVHPGLTGAALSDETLFQDRRFVPYRRG